MLNCFSTSQVRRFRTPDRESLCQRLRRGLIPSRLRRPLCGSSSTITDTLGKAPPGLTATRDRKRRPHYKVYPCPNTYGTTKVNIPVQFLPTTERPSCSAQDSPEPDAEILGSQSSPGWDSEATATRLLDALRNLLPISTDPVARKEHSTGSYTKIRPKLVSTLPDPATYGKYFKGSCTEIRPVRSAQAARAQSLPNLFMPVCLSSKPNYSKLSAPSTPRTNTSILQTLSMGTDITAPHSGASLSVRDLSEEFEDLCCLDEKDIFTKTWVKEEGDPHTLSLKLELEEAFRLSEGEEEYEFSLHAPHPAAEQPCLEDRSWKAAGLWRKFYCTNGHTFEAKCFCRRALCAVCKDHVAGLGCLVYKCVDCKILVHKRCHTLVTTGCEQHSSVPDPVTPMNLPPTASHPPQTLSLSHSSSHFSWEQLAGEDEDIKTTRARGQAPSRLGLQDFNILRVIGRGSYAKVYLVQPKNKDQKFAMKVVKKDSANYHRAKTEQRILQHVSSHPFLVGLHSFFHTKHRVCFLLDCASGGDLMLHMQRHGVLSEPHARFYAAEISLALNYLHQRGVLYRNLKLDNVLLDSEGHIKLADYCISKEGLGPGDVTGTFCGTPNYLAPEIVKAEDYGLSVDWWSLGVILYEMMAGESPFPVENPDAPSINHLLLLILESTILIPAHLSVEAASILQGFLKKDPKERLGCGGDTGFEDIQHHLFFQNVDWDLIEQRRVVPPFKPKISGEFGLENFDPRFTKEPVWLTPEDKDSVTTTKVH